MGPERCPARDGRPERAAAPRGEPNLVRFGGMTPRVV